MTTLIPKFDLKNGSATPTGAVNRNIYEKLAESVSVLDFGAVGNGTTDDTSAFNNAWSFANPKAVLVPAGSYKITGTVTGKFYSFGAVTIVTGTVTSITNLVP
jgi:polygalacturonase